MPADGRTYSSCVRDAIAASKAGKLDALRSKHGYAVIADLKDHLLELHNTIAVLQDELNRAHR